MTLRTAFMHKQDRILCAAAQTAGMETRYMLPHQFPATAPCVNVDTVS